MRLVHIDDDGSFSLVEFVGEDAPPYAILSHTWGADHEEVTYQDMVQGTGGAKSGFEKICLCARQAAEDDLAYFWVDTCCSFDKSSSAELTESINSMFQWYRAAKVCYVFLADLEAGAALEDEMHRCRWFSRGWTLQELVAPATLKFYSKNWQFKGTKHDQAEVLEAFTKIPSGVLLGLREPSSVCVAVRMSWAANRQTKRQEDMAYCLLGIFDVNMPMIYGEGKKAFRRLQEEIIKRENDLTILAWDPSPGTYEYFVGCFAPSPKNFANCSDILPFPDLSLEFSTTNRGLLMTTELNIRTAEFKQANNSRQIVYFINLGFSSERRMGIHLRKLGPSLFCRLHDYDDMDSVVSPYVDQRVGNFYIVLDPQFSKTKISDFYRMCALHVPFADDLRVETALPKTLWDHTDRLFLTKSRYATPIHPMVLALKLRVYLETGDVPITVVCDYRTA
ncbi:uncharacterized protein SETTUDRAFT_97772 [Exserohilum turcica Et28A]|uniref:Heterokaryon incompatibility domain-containing protein n=1 Tax=Exserohilum turcicum (strain 28A) TaxID=671987 RepID=R0I8D4_EXST2|nr:uncharacterized protein SETTUDRAFT_97772 [Exserohilum turcica Et28A]EOA81790.1 hypothetical protein SETTUDRAFT_97772 [Exserohilum turcica Et28A]